MGPWQRGYWRVSMVMMVLFGPPYAGINGRRRLCYHYSVNPVDGPCHSGYQRVIGGYHCVGNGVRFFSFASFVLRPFRRRHRHQHCKQIPFRISALSSFCLRNPLTPQTFLLHHHHHSKQQKRRKELWLRNDTRLHHQPHARSLCRFRFEFGSGPNLLRCWIGQYLQRKGWRDLPLIGLTNIYVRIDGDFCCCRFVEEEVKLV